MRDPDSAPGHHFPIQRRPHTSTDFIKTRHYGDPPRAGVRQRQLYFVGRNFFCWHFVGIEAARNPTGRKMPTLFDDASKMPLTDTRILSLKPVSHPRRYSDGYGLYLEVTPGGSKLWKLAYLFEGSVRDRDERPAPLLGLPSCGRLGRSSRPPANMSSLGILNALQDQGRKPSDTVHTEGAILGRATGRRRQIGAINSIVF